MKVSETAGEILGRHFSGIRDEAIPAEQKHKAKTLVTDYFGVAIGGSQTDSADIAARFVLSAGGREEASLIGRRESKVPAVHAAFANAIASHSIEMDDVDVLALFHFSPPVVSAALAAAELADSTGAEFVSAVVLGCEMMARASDATNFSLRNRGFHTTPSCGVFGAAVAAGRLLKLSADQMTSALGLAGAQASGLMEMYGPSMQKRFNPGPAARNGLTAALMARLGYTGAATILDGERGFCRAFSDEPDFSKLTDGLGTDFPIYIEYKPYSCARPIHNAIDCALDVRNQLGEPPEAIESITMLRHPAWAQYHLNPRPATYHEAQVSLPYSVAVALIEGEALPPQYNDEKLNDPSIQRLSEMVQVFPDESLLRGVSCRMTVTTRDGRTLVSQVDHPLGSIERPMPSERVNHKLHMLADPVIGKAGVDNLVDLVGSLEGLDTVGALMRASQPSA
ncbi:MmgE/PrpD family protein [Pseudochelatococcus sp. B33]